MVGRHTSSGTDMVSDGDRKIRDSIDYTSRTESARLMCSIGEFDNVNLDPDEIEEDLISELRAIAEGKFELGGDLQQVSAFRSDKSNRLNLLSMGNLTVKNFDVVPLDAQSNIATEAANVSHVDASMVMHSEMGDKMCLSNTRAVANQLASGAYGSEVEYSNSHYH